MNATPRPARPPDERRPRALPPRRPTGGPHRTGQVLYRQPGLWVTTEWFVAAGRQFPVAELARLQTARGPNDPVTARAVGVTAAVLAGVGVVLGFTRDTSQVDPRTFLALGAAAFVPIVLSAIGQRFRPRSFELWGEYQGRMVLLFSTDDERQYGQVTRALMRAREMTRLGAVAEPVASTVPWLPRPR